MITRRLLSRQSTFAALLLCVSNAVAGEIAGKVVTPTMKGVDGALVVVRDAQGERGRAVTDNFGDFVIWSIQPGSVTVIVGYGSDEPAISTVAVSETGRVMRWFMRDPARKVVVPMLPRAAPDTERAAARALRWFGVEQIVGPLVTSVFVLGNHRAAGAIWLGHLIADAGLGTASAFSLSAVSRRAGNWFLVYEAASVGGTVLFLTGGWNTTGSVGLLSSFLAPLALEPAGRALETVHPVAGARLKKMGRSQIGISAVGVPVTILLARSEGGWGGLLVGLLGGALTVVVRDVVGGIHALEIARDLEGGMFLSGMTPDSRLAAIPGYRVALRW